jgi:hypothetical protein
MSKKNYEFDDLEQDNWSDYKKTSKKRMKHREEPSSNSWKRNAKLNYTIEEDDYYEQEDQVSRGKVSRR